MGKTRSPQINTIRHGDCIKGMKALKAGGIDLAFADPPFNIGYEYDVYDDKLEREHYLDWSKQWIAGVYRALKDDGTFWLAIGDEYAAELKLISQDVGFHCRSWVIWYYTFGVNCKHKFSRSHAHLFYFVKDPDSFTFRSGELENRIPSARQLVYNDKRANSKGRLPDDTWIIRPADAAGVLDASEEELLPPPTDDDRTWTLRPQDLEACFSRDEDTWYFPRVAGTFKERAGFHGCQMPEQLLGRIIRLCSHEGETVLDPFSGSATTLAVAKKLGRKYLGFELSDEYVKHGLTRLDGIRVGDRLDGSPEPLVSAPSTKGGKREFEKRKKQQPAALDGDDQHRDRQLQLTVAGVKEAYRQAHAGFSADRVVADPELNESFIDSCRRSGIAGDPRSWNALLFRLRKAGELADVPTTQRTALSWEDCDGYLFASEIALQTLLEAGVPSLDAVLCDPDQAAEFDRLAATFAPGWTPLEYRWAALKLRKQAKLARTRAGVLAPPDRLGRRLPVQDLQANALPDAAGLYVVSRGQTKRLYVGETFNLRERLEGQFTRDGWASFGEGLVVQTLEMRKPAETLAYQSRLAQKYKPALNYRELWTTG